MITGRLRGWAGRATLGLVVLALAGCAVGTPAAPAGGAGTATPAPQGVVVVEPPGLINDFTLTSQANKPMKFSELRGRLALVTFGYTHCPDVCPVNLARFKQVRIALETAADQVNFVFISVDGKRDTPEVLAMHLAAFDETFIGLTGEETAVRQVAKDFGVIFYVTNDARTQADYLVTHTASSFLVGREGWLRRVYAYGTEPEIVAADIKAMLKLGK